MPDYCTIPGRVRREVSCKWTSGQSRGCCDTRILFADDMVVMEQGEGDLKKLLRMVGEYGRDWKMQFNSSKSRVVNIGKKSSKDKRWQVGEGQI